MWLDMNAWDRVIHLLVEESVVNIVVTKRIATLSYRCRRWTEHRAGHGPRNLLRCYLQLPQRQMRTGKALSWSLAFKSNYIRCANAYGAEIELA